MLSRLPEELPAPVAMAATGAAADGAATGASMTATGAAADRAATGAGGAATGAAPGAMTYLTSWDSALVALASSPPGTAVSVCFDTRTDLTYARPLGSLRKAWAYSRRRDELSEIPAHVHIELIGSESAPSSLGECHHFWAKVWLARELLKHPNVGWVLWLDSDAAPVPIIPCRGEGLKFPALDVLVKEALRNAQPQAEDQPRAAVNPNLDDFAFLGYREKSAPPSFKPVMNAGVFILRKGELASRLMDLWWSRRRGSNWKPRGRAGDCPGCEQTEFELMLQCRAKRQPPATQMPATGGAVQRRPATKRPATGGAARRKPAAKKSQPPAAPLEAPLEKVGDGVFLAPETSFCDQGRGLVGATPFVHFYGRAQWVGKSQVGAWLEQFMVKLPARMRQEFPAVRQHLRKRAQPSNRSGRSRNTQSIQRALGSKVVYKGKVYASIRLAHEATGKSRQFLRQFES